MSDVLREAMLESTVKRASTDACYFCERQGDFNRTLFTWKGKSIFVMECACDLCKKLIKRYGGKKYEPH